MAKTEAEKDAGVKTERDQVKYWLDEISSAQKREKDFRKDGKVVVKLYEGGKADTAQYNILYSNTDTLAPALYNTTPRPVVQRRFKDADPLGKEASTATQRILEFEVDPGDAQYTPFDDLLRSAVLEALVPGRGVTKFKYDAKFTKEGGTERIKEEYVCGEEVPWDRFCHGYAKKWEQVPWVAFEEHLTKDEVKENFPDADIDFAKLDFSDDDISGDEDDNTNGEKTGAKLLIVHGVWSKLHKKVFFVSPTCPEKFLKTEDDPLGLAGFFPCPKPLAFVQKISTLVPVALYKMYEEQAKELNLVTLRLNRLIASCKIRGMFDSSIEGIAEALKADDNVLVPIENVAGMTSQGLKLENAFWIFPLDKIVAVIQQLYLAREQIKRVIFEITGIADIMRGSSNASETLGAQEIKNQWGTLRLKRAQKEVMRYVRDCLRLMAEISVSKLGEDTLSKMTGLPYPTGAQQEQMQQQLQQFQLQMMQPPQELVQASQQPGWPQILKLLQNDLMRAYRIDIETNSTVDAEATEDKQNISELLNAMAQFLNGVAPMVEQGILPFEAAQSMLLAITRRFRFGTDVEDALKQMKAPQKQDDGEAQKMQFEMEKSKAEFEHDKQMKAMDLQLKQQEMTMKMQLMKAELALKEREMQMKLEEMNRKAELATQQALLKMRQTTLQTQASAVQHQQSMEQGDIQHQHSLEQGEQQAALAQQGADHKSQQMKDQAAAAKAKAKTDASKPKKD